MPSKNLLLSRLGLSRASFSVLFILINAFLWYYLTLNIITTISKNFNLELSELLVLHSLGVIVAGIIGISFSKNRYKILLLWTFLGTTASLLPLLMSNSVPLCFRLVCLIWGFSFGLGMPLCLGYFAENVPIENRGRLSGIAFLVSFFCAIPVAGLGESFGLPVLYLVFGLWRLLGFVPLLISQSVKKKIEFGENDGKYVASWAYDRRLYLYLVPWFMFNVIDNLEGLLLGNFIEITFLEYYNFLQLAYLLFLGVFAFFGGFLCDFIGRKPIVILGFATMGIAYAIISIIPKSLPAWFFFSICYGFAWGVFYTIFVILIWGDLAPKGLEEKYYFVGNLPLFFATIFQLFFAHSMMFANETSAFSLAAFFLFLSVLPILFAPETLPEKAIKERELKQYVEKAKKIKEKFT